MRRRKGIRARVTRRKLLGHNRITLHPFPEAVCWFALPTHTTVRTSSYVVFVGGFHHFRKRDLHTVVSREIRLRAMGERTHRAVLKRHIQGEGCDDM